MGLESRLRKLEGAVRPEAQDEHERQKRLKMVREGAEQANERFYRYLAIERRTAYLEDVGYGGHGPGDLRDENFLYADDKPPFTISEEGKVFSTRDGKPITRYPQTLGEVWSWEEVEEGNLQLIHDEEAQVFYTPEGEMVLSRDHVDLQHLFNGMRDAEE